MSTTFNTLIGCPTDCTTVARPAIPVDQNCTGYRQLESQISDLFIRYNGAPDPFAAVATTGSTTYVASSVDNTTTDGTKCHWLVGKGGIPVPEKEVSVYPKRKKRVAKRTFTLTFEIQNLNDAMRSSLLKWQCGDTNFAFYFADVEDYLYGKQGGLIPESVDVDMPQGGGDGDKASAFLIITFIADGNPARTNNPYN